MSIWTPMRKRTFLLPLPNHDQRLLPAIRPNMRRTGRSLPRPDLQIVQEFRAKLKIAEDLISKLAYNLQEIQDFWRKPKSPESKAPPGDSSATINPLPIGERSRGKRP